MQLGEGTGKDASVHELRNRRTYDADERRPRRAAQGARGARSAGAEPAAEASAQRPPRPAPHAPPRDPHRRDHAPRPPRPAAPPTPPAAPHRRLRLAARAHARLPALRLGRAGRDVHVRHPAHADHEGAAPPRRRHRARRGRRGTVDDADGGTRIGAALQEFLDTPRYADRARGALTIVLSDGLERGDPAQMVHAVRRLKRLSHRLLWWTPLGARPDLPADHARDGGDPATTSPSRARATSRRLLEQVRRL